MHTYLISPPPPKTCFRPGTTLHSSPVYTIPTPFHTIHGSACFSVILCHHALFEGWTIGQADCCFFKCGVGRCRISSTVRSHEVIWEEKDWNGKARNWWCIGDDVGHVLCRGKWKIGTCISHIARLLGGYSICCRCMAKGWFTCDVWSWYVPFSEIGTFAQQKQNLIPSRPPGNISHQKGKFGKSSTQKCLLTGGNMWVRRRVDVKRKLWLSCSASPMFPCFCSYGVPFLINKLLISFEDGLQNEFSTSNGFWLNSNNNNNKKHTHIYFQVHPISLFVWVFPVLFGWKLVGWLVLYSSRRQPQWQSVSSFFTRALAFERFLQRLYINQMWPCMEYTFPSLNQQFAPENRPAQKESSFPTFIFQGQC